MEENKMKVIQNLLVMGVGAGLGIGAGYFFFKPDPVDCKQVYAEELARVEEAYKEVPLTPGIASPKDLGIEYVVSKEAGFKGLVFTDTFSGRKGVVVKAQALGENSFTMAYANLEQVLAKPDVSMALPPGVQLYSAKDQKKE